MAKGTRMKVEVDFIAKTEKLDKAFNRINKQREFADAKMRLSNKGHIRDMNSNKRIGEEVAASRMVAHRREMKHAQEMRGVMLGRNLSWMFFGMMVQRTMSGVLRSLTNTYKVATQGDSALGNATTRLSASWEFLKFSIMNALDNPGFIRFIDWITRGIQWVGNFVAENEWAAYAILGTFATLFTFGTFLALFGQMALAWGATTVWMAATTAGGGMAPFAAGGAARLAFTNFIKWMGGLAVVVFAIEGFLDVKEGDFLGWLGKSVGIFAFARIAGVGSPHALVITAAILVTQLMLGGGFFDKFENLRESTGGDLLTEIFSWIGPTPGGVIAQAAGIQAFWEGITGFSKDVENLKEKADELDDAQSNNITTMDTFSGVTIPSNLEQMNNMKDNWETFREQTMNNQTAVDDLGESINDLPTEKHIYIYTHHINQSSTD